jgi:hypothetical protein
MHCCESVTDSFDVSTFHDLRDFLQVFPQDGVGYSWDPGTRIREYIQRDCLISLIPSMHLQASCSSYGRPIFRYTTFGVSPSTLITLYLPQKTLSCTHCSEYQSTARFPHVQDELIYHRGRYLHGKAWNSRNASVVVDQYLTWTFPPVSRIS